jgi:hypothetical protein
MSIKKVAKAAFFNDSHAEKLATFAHELDVPYSVFALDADALRAFLSW